MLCSILFSADILQSEQQSEWLHRIMIVNKSFQEEANTPEA